MINSNKNNENIKEKIFLCKKVKRHNKIFDIKKIYLFDKL